MKKLTQCKLVQGNLTQTAWIPSNDAEVGWSVVLKGYDGEWDVAAVYDTVALDWLDRNRVNLKGK